ncbi:hypothetical protein CMO90_01945 [Candidatus Woesearchaeota archaeon]|nr:hypothetical protein [Candidatus Woesearchaeota archaeon]
MLIQKNFLKKTKDFGINTYEAKIWTALLSRGVSTAGELSDIANVPRSRSYDVLESLEKKGFILVKLGKPIKYLAVPPKEVLERVKKKVQEETDFQIQSLNEIKKSEIFNELNKLHDTGISLVDPSDLTTSFKGRDKLMIQLETMIKSAEKSIILMSTEEGIIRKISGLSKPLKKAQKRGVRIKIVAPLTDRTKDSLEEAKFFSEVNFSDIKGRFCLVDNKQILFMLSDDENTHSSFDAGVWAETNLFSQTLNELFLKAIKKESSVIRH